jgi:leucyl aminopeptidase
LSAACFSIALAGCIAFGGSKDGVFIDTGAFTGTAVGLAFVATVTTLALGGALVFATITLVIGLIGLAFVAPVTFAIDLAGLAGTFALADFTLGIADLGFADLGFAVAFAGFGFAVERRPAGIGFRLAGVFAFRIGLEGTWLAATVSTFGPRARFPPIDLESRPTYTYNGQAMRPLSFAPASGLTEPVDLLGVVAFEEDLPKLDEPGLAALDQALQGNLRKSLAEERFRGKPGQAVTLQTNGALGARRIAVVGAGPRARFVTADAQHHGAKLARLANGVGARTLTIAQPAGLPATDELMRLEALSRGLSLGVYRFDKYLAEDKREAPTLESVRLQVSAGLPPDAAARALSRGARVAAATANARDLVNEPAGVLTPTRLAELATARAKAAGVEATVLDVAACRARNMGLFLAVAQGSAEPPQFIHLAWRPAKPVKRVVLVGKGVTFDSGGLSLKTNDGMLGMKADMAGAAAVLSAVTVIAEEKLPIEVHALAACTENMPSGTAYKLGDVIRSMAGKTIEINNTDAEGRLTLADALTYGLALQPDMIFDFATLTGACMVALGPHMAGVMSNDEELATKWLAAAHAAGEDMWRLPLPPRLIEQLKSDVADMRNTGERWGGALTAGHFLKEFVGTTPWVHVDLAGPATADKEWGILSKGATGFGVATIVEYLRSLIPAQ